MFHFFSNGNSKYHHRAKRFYQPTLKYEYLSNALPILNLYHLSNKKLHLGQTDQSPIFSHVFFNPLSHPNEAIQNVTGEPCNTFITQFWDVATDNKTADQQKNSENGFSAHHVKTQIDIITHK